MTLTSQAVLAELDTTLPQASESWRSTALRQVVDLFLSGAEIYSNEQIALFDEVMRRLIPSADRLLLAELSNQLAPLGNTPVKVLGMLARHMDMAVCGPVIEQAKAVPDKDLAEAADRDRVDLHLLMKIAARPQLGETVTDVLLKRGNAAIQRSIIDNPNARISEAGYARLVMGLNGDKNLATAIAARDDLPAELRPWLAATLGQ